MKRILFIIVGVLMLHTTVKASEILIYDEATGYAIEYISSANTPDYSGRTDVLINPTLPQSVPTKYMIVNLSTDEVTEMNQEDKDVVEAAIQAEIDASLSSQIDSLDISFEDFLTAYTKVFKARIEAAAPITLNISGMKQDVINQIKSDKGL